MTVRVAVDVHGADRGPAEVAAGAASAATPQLEPVLYGPHGVDAHGLPLV